MEWNGVKKHEDMDVDVEKELVMVLKWLEKPIANTMVIGIEPTESNVLSDGEPGPHKIQGIGAGFVPCNLDEGVVDEVTEISSYVAVKMVKQWSLQVGLLVGSSFGAAAAAARKAGSRSENAGKLIAVVFLSANERYLSSLLFQSISRVLRLELVWCRQMLRKGFEKVPEESGHLYCWDWNRRKVWRVLREEIMIVVNPTNQY